MVCKNIGRWAFIRVSAGHPHCDLTNRPAFTTARNEIRNVLLAGLGRYGEGPKRNWDPYGQGLPSSRTQHNHRR